MDRDDRRAEGSRTAFLVAFVPGVTPDRWAGRWRERRLRPDLELRPVAEDRAEPAVRSREVDMAVARLPVDRDGLHCIPLYDETPHVIAARDHVLAAYDTVPITDLAHEQFVLGPPAGLEARAKQLDFSAMSVPEAIEVAASGTGVVVVPQGVARLHHRKDVVHRPVEGLPTTRIGLVWLVEREDEQPIQAFIGIVRGRTVNSTRG